MAGLQNRKQQVSPIDLFRTANEIAHAVRIRAGVRGCAEDVNAQAGAILVISGPHFRIPPLFLAWDEQQSSNQQGQNSDGDDLVCGGHITLETLRFF
jgi:hypothetical protein